MNHRRAFGVGCFHFGDGRSAPFEFSSPQHIEAIKNALGNLPSLSEIEITSSDETFSIRVTEDTPPFADGYLFPQIPFLTISFKAFIPQRVQEELFPEEPRNLQTGTETFRVTVQDSYHGPVTFVECLNPSADCQPSDSVRLLREFIQREFSKTKSLITFEALGPSPFHANFFLESIPSGDEGITFKETKQRGYNDFVFNYGPSLEIDEALDLIYHELSDELGLYYDIQRRSVRLMRSGDQLLSDWLSLLSLVNEPAPFWNLSSRFKIHRAAQSLVSKSYSLEAQFAVERDGVSRDVASTYGQGTPTYLNQFIQEQANSLPSYPIQSILKWAEHIETASFKRAEIAAVVISAIGGGVIGSFATLLTSNHS